jgi:hypothetical protein
MSQNPPNLPFQSLCVAVERAKKVKGLDDGPWTVGVRNTQGELLASAMLDHHAQVKAFTEAMEDLGFVPAAFEAQENMRCCDYTFRLRDEVPAGEPSLAAA